LDFSVQVVSIYWNISCNNLLFLWYFEQLCNKVASLWHHYWNGLICSWLHDCCLWKRANS